MDNDERTTERGDRFIRALVWMRRLLLALALTGGLGGAVFADGGDAVPTPEARLEDFLAVLPKSRPERRVWVEANIAADVVARRGLDALTGMTADVAEALGAARPRAVTTDADGVHAEFDTAEGERLRLTLRLGPAPERRIAGVMLRPADGPPPAPISATELPAALASLVAERAAKGFSGGVLVARDGVPLFAGAYGLANRATGRANTLDTPINLGSMNKMFTAVVIGRLVDEGRLRWDDPVGRHLPDWPQPAVRERVTLRHLLSHGSGLEAYWGEAHDRQRATLDDTAEYAALCADQPPAAEPGTAFGYSNCGFVLLGAVAERVTGKDYYTLVRDYVYAPAGMTHSDHYARDDEASGRAVGYLPDGADNGAFLARRGSAAGGGYASANDLLRFAEALRGGRLVSAATWAEMSRPQWPMGSPGGPMSYGLGFGVIDAEGERHVGHNGGAPGISAEFAWFPGSGYVVIVLSNHDRGAGDLARALRQRVAAPSVTTPPAVGQRATSASGPGSAR